MLLHFIVFYLFLFHADPLLLAPLPGSLPEFFLEQGPYFGTHHPLHVELYEHYLAIYGQVAEEGHLLLHHRVHPDLLHLQHRTCDGLRQREGGDLDSR